MQGTTKGLSFPFWHMTKEQESEGGKGGVRLRLRETSPLKNCATGGQGSRKGGKEKKLQKQVEREGGRGTKGGKGQIVGIPDNNNLRLFLWFRRGEEWEATTLTTTTAGGESDGGPPLSTQSGGRAIKKVGKGAKATTARLEGEGEG